MSTLVESLELRALEQRNRLHKTATELRTKVSAAREQWDVLKNAREHLIGASVVVSILGFFSGYGLAGIFTDHYKEL
jgi:hypothetical protein